MHSVTNLKLGAGSYAGASFRQIDSSSLHIGGYFALRDTDSDGLVELKPRKATLGDSRRVFQGVPGGPSDGRTECSIMLSSVMRMITEGHVL